MKKKKFELIKSNAWEIKETGSLKTLGGLIALCHVLQFYFWSANGRLPLKLADQGMAMCWPIMESCGFMQLPSFLLIGPYYAYAFLMSLAALILLFTDWVVFGAYVFVAGFFFGCILYFQDLRISTNAGYFVILLSLAYLFVPSKAKLMRRLIVSFFVARGLSQCAPDFLTGGWYMEHLPRIPVKLGEWLAAMSVLIQMIGGASLLFRDGRYFFSGWLALFFYELLQLAVGEYFAASLGLCTLLYVAIDEWEIRKAERQYLYQSFSRPEPSFLAAGIFLGFFWIAQASPFLNMPRGSGFKNFLSTWAVSPEAAHEECEQKTLAIFKDRIEEYDVRPTMARNSAMQCNPYLRYLDLKALCKTLAKEPKFETLSSILQVRNLREKTAFRAFEVQDFCNENLTFKRAGEVQWTMNPAK